MGVEGDKDRPQCVQARTKPTMLLNFATLGRQMGSLHNLRLAIDSTAVLHIRFHEACALQIRLEDGRSAVSSSRLSSRQHERPTSVQP
jgi:hypothetical protein